MSIDLRHVDLDALSRCDFTKEIIGIRIDRKGQREIVILSKNDITIGQRILRCIGKGKLAHTETSLLKVTALLSEYRWADAAKYQRKDSDGYLGYQKACQLANKALLLKKDKTLLYSFGAQLKIENASLTQVRKKEDTYSEIRPIVMWNPEMQYLHINAQLQQIFHNSTVAIESKEFDEMSIDETEVVPPMEDFSNWVFHVKQVLC